MATPATVRALPRTLRQQVTELQQELAVARQANAAFFDHALALLCTAGFDGYFKQLNPMWSRVLGFAEEELRAEPFLSFVHPDDVAATIAAAEQLGAEGRDVVSFENRYRCKDGSYRWLRWSSTPDMERGLIYAVVQDVTQERAAEEQLQLYHQIFQHTLTGLIVLQLDDPDDVASLRLISANPAARDFTGIDLKHEAGRRFVEIFPNAVESGLSAVYAAVARDGGTRDLGEARYHDQRIGDNTFTVRAFALPGRKVAVAFENITARKQAEDAARQQAQLTSLILEHMSDGVIAVDPQGAFTTFNPAAARLFGMGASDVASEEWSAAYGIFQLDQVTPFPSHELPLARTLEGEVTNDVELFVRHAGAPEGRWASVSGRPLQGPDGTLMGGVVVCRDVTERRQAETQLRLSEARFRDIALNIPGAVFQFTSRQGVWSTDFMSERITGLAGVSAAEVMRDFSVFVARVHPDDLDAYVASVTGAVERLTPWHFEGRFLRPDGQVRWWMGDSVPVQTDTGEIVFNGVLMDITTQREAEEALRQSLVQEQIIRAQRATLEELSTPLIPISDKIVVMPLIGAVDTRRAQQVLETLLEGIARTGAETAILDITGVSVVDTQVANALIRAAQAVKLLGAQVMLTGIRPEVAQTLVGLGVDLGGIITRGSLQSGIALAMRDVELGRR